MEKTLLSLAPLPVPVVKSLLGLAPGVGDTEIIAGHDMSDDEVGKPSAKRMSFLATSPSSKGSAGICWPRRDQ